MNGYYQQQTYYSQGAGTQNRQRTSPAVNQNTGNAGKQSNSQQSGGHAAKQSSQQPQGSSYQQQSRMQNPTPQSTDEIGQDQYEDKQIIRKDAKNCFVESLWDSFSKGKAHLGFASYDMNLAPGSRQTNKVNIYIAMPEIFRLCMNLSNGIMLSQYHDSQVTTIYETMGGTSAKMLQRYGKPRTDGKSLSRVMKIMKGRNGFLLIASSGPGTEDEKGLIVPQFGKNPENHIVLPISWDGLCELLLMTQHAYQTWAIVNQKYKEK